jgi:integrase
VPRIPTYRLHKASGRAAVTLGGRHYYLGRHGTPESWAEYHRLVAEWLATGRHPRVAGRAPGAGPTVEQVAAAYLEFAYHHYVMDGRPTGEPGNIQLALRPARRLYGHTPARDFGPLRLKTVRQEMIDSGLCRNEVNRRFERVLGAFRWALEEELIPASTFEALRIVPLLRPGQAGVRESEPVRPVDDASVDAIRPYVSRQVWAMVELQRLTGMRPGEARCLRTQDVDTSGPIWVYTPATHKMQAFGRQRRIQLGPLAQEVLRPWLRGEPTAFLFQPREAVAEYRAARALVRKGRYQPRPPRRRGGRGRPHVVAGQQYSKNTYRAAITYGIAKANREAERTGGARVPHWHPNQLRHAAATRIRREFGLDAARAVLGHHSIVTAKAYVELDEAKAAEIMRRIG